MFVISMKTILAVDKQELIEQGSTRYLLVQQKLRQMLETNNLGEEFDNSKHSVVVRTGLNNRGQMYCEFWFEKK